MSSRKKTKVRKRYIKKKRYSPFQYFCTFIIIILILGISYWLADDLLPNNTLNNNFGESCEIKAELDRTIYPENSFLENQIAITKKMSLHFLDVGQADSIIIELPNGQNMLIDAGNDEDANAIDTYLSDLKIKKLDYIVITHPDEDHIGGADKIIANKNYEIGSIFMSEREHTTKAFCDTLANSVERNEKIYLGKNGVTLIDLPDLQVSFISPINSTYTDINAFSIVTKICFKEKIFLLTGDAVVKNENEMIDNSISLKADLLKVPHHGSDTSSSIDFINHVNPQYSIIQVGLNNKYNLPKENILERLKNSKIFRNDLNGNIVAQSDGLTIEMSSQK